MHIDRITSTSINELAHIEVYYDNREGVKGHFTCTGVTGKLVPVIWSSRNECDLISKVTALYRDAVFDNDSYD